jgi:hypothetical protein
MQYRTLGRTGVQVSTLVLGAMNFGSLGRTTKDEVTAMVDAALEGGTNLIDTADMYSQGGRRPCRSLPDPPVGPEHQRPRRRDRPAKTQVPCPLLNRIVSHPC